MSERDSLLSDFGLGVSRKRARRCTACLVTTVVGLMFVNDRTSGAF